jgi:hypothetical protein
MNPPAVAVGKNTPSIRKQQSVVYVVDGIILRSTHGSPWLVDAK